LVMAIDVPIWCAGVRVCSGDLVFGDADGAVVVPKEAEKAVLDHAFEKISGENSTMDDLRNGAYLRDVWARYGIL